MSAPISTHEEAVASWKANAAYWDNGIQEGNKYWNRLQEPALTRMIAFRPLAEARVLELATGNGLVARWLVDQGASVLATDVSTEMLDFARRREKPHHEGKIAYRQLDATNPEALGALADEHATAGGFDVVVMNMAIMDISTIEPLAAALPKFLKKDGIFVATLLHPVFFTCGARRNIQIADGGPDGYPEIIRTKIIEKYLDVPPYHGVALYGQPAQQIYYHRPLHELFSTFFKTGLVMDAMEEPAFTSEDAMPERLEASSNYTQLPAILAFRLRRLI
ncbi:S-adenosyl-L-methionine-dependent methyltransferase [Xylaria bambusicola]|uniref:S-adenosyl-L-methionine-dependent methyltransferase n=1 Tax=Xylaria bambusicola TaxID=326684 RepID=UPI00200757A3|nr:S-adenosyl-L-methionine-dependent methyltransferase [Xylaria bambusicola]KAI0517418.1 S-adenosyl-L-methionine-dependent methyltransferase [Xylaria bambusicola]